MKILPTPNRWLNCLFLIICLMQSSITSSQVSDVELMPGSGETEEDEDFGLMSLEQLMDIEVTVASKKATKLGDIPAAVYVVTGDEIRRVGATSIPEALRLIPGFYVSHWTTSAYDVTARGFGNGTALSSQAFQNQLLVMIDGVSVYSPLFPGTWWALQDLDLKDVDRIEVIRGPGGIVWGSNSLNGIVNVITKKATDTEGVRISTSHANDERHSSISATILLGENASVRTWVKNTKWDTNHNPVLGFDQSYSITTAGARADWISDSGLEYNLWFRAYNAALNQNGFDLTFFVDIPVHTDKEGGQISLSITDPENDSRVVMWYSKDVQDFPTTFELDIETYDIEYQKERDLSENQHLTFGIGYRQIQSDVFGDDIFFFDLDPVRFEQGNFRAFVLDTIDFPDSHMQLTIGVQVEKNEFTNFEVQPSIRGTWKPTEQSTIWAAISRAVRTPSLEERFLTPNSLFIGDPNYRAEELTAYEMGARVEIAERVAVDLATYYNDYHNLNYQEDVGIFGQRQNSNRGGGYAYGAELGLDVRINDRWSMRSAYTYINERLVADLPGGGTTRINSSEYHPESNFNLRSYYTINSQWELDMAVYAVGGFGEVYDGAAYTRGDVRLGYRPSDQFEFSVGIQNWNNSLHSEFSQFSQIRRSVFFSMDWTP